MKKILIIEDNYMMRVFLLNYLGKTYDVKAVESPSEALILSAKGVNFHMVISDYQISNSEEEASLYALNMQLSWQGTSLFVLTDEDKSDQRINALSAGAKDTLSKPFNPQELNLRINTMLDQENQFTGLRTVA